MYEGDVVAFYAEKNGDLITFLAAQSGISSRVGTGTAAKIYPLVEPQKATGQSIVIWRAGGTQYANLQGDNNCGRDTVHFFCYGSKSSDADALEKALYDAIGAVRSQMIGSTYVHQIAAIGRPEQGYDDPRDGGAERRYWTKRVYDITLVA